MEKPMTMTLEEMQADWPKIRQMIQSGGRAIEGLLEVASVCDMQACPEGTTVTLAYTHPFLKEFFEDPRTIAIMESCLAEILRQAVMVRCVLKKKGKADGSCR